ncbi:hypothetical protein SAMN05421770_101836 [Granulicella rosea]|uniref:Uncharacterized protein n=1 Tax=Granulicella rosea TaxID=474952 RepID=A0A239E9B6_9BACT|nr:hypothetical protein [Granulicella rosea]SNS40512.1 hypothetical protein SAMN05421770_101836 [Granulicella rosea]
MTANRTQEATIDERLILELKIDASGEVTRKPTKLGRKDTLEGKLLGQIYPGIRVARVSVPYELTPYEQSVVENRMASLVYGGVEYKLVGASGSAKDGKFYFVDQAHARQIAERFQHWPEAAIVYFAILVSDCKLMVEEPELRIAVVKDHVLGTNDCRGWVRESLYRKLKIGTNRFCQFRLAFDTREPKQAKGALKAMSDRVADKLEVDVVLPESACKPSLKGGVHFLPLLGTSGRIYTGPAILGIKEISRQSEFGSSYTLVEHASDDSLQLEIMPRAIEQIRKVKKAWDDGDYEALFEVLGRSEAVSLDDDASFDPEALEQNGSGVSEECEPAEAVLLADRSGNSIKFPYVAKRSYRLSPGRQRESDRWVCASSLRRVGARSCSERTLLLPVRHRGDCKTYPNSRPRSQNPHPGWLGFRESQRHGTAAGRGLSPLPRRMGTRGPKRLGEPR